MSLHAATGEQQKAAGRPCLVVLLFPGSELSVRPGENAEGNQDLHFQMPQPTPSLTATPVAHPTFQPHGLPPNPA